MILHKLIIHCASEQEPTLDKTFVWNAGDDIFSVECAIAKLQEWVDKNKTKTPVDVALANSNPLPPPL